MLSYSQTGGILNGSNGILELYGGKICGNTVQCYSDTDPSPAFAVGIDNYSYKGTISISPAGAIAGIAIDGSDAQEIPADSYDAFISEIGKYGYLEFAYSEPPAVTTTTIITTTTKRTTTTTTTTRTTTTTVTTTTTTTTTGKPPEILTPENQAWMKLQKDLLEGGDIQLTNDAIWEEGLELLIVPEDVSVTLDLNGYKIDRNLTYIDDPYNDDPDNDDLFRTNGNVITNYGTLTVTDSKKDGMICGGRNDPNGGGIYNTGTLILESGNISNNHAPRGGGIYNAGTVTLNNGSISNNYTSFGGGIYNAGTVTLNSGQISSNHAKYGGGIYNAGTVTLNSGHIFSNHAEYGGGIENDKAAMFTMNDGVISGNSTEEDTGEDSSGESLSSGAGVCNHGSFILNGGRISQNYTDYTWRTTEALGDLEEQLVFEHTVCSNFNNAVNNTGIFSVSSEKNLYVGKINDGSDKQFIPAAGHRNVIDDISAYAYLELSEMIPSDDMVYFTGTAVSTDPEIPDSEPVPISDWSALNSAFSNGGYYILEKTMQPSYTSATLQVPEGVIVCIDLNGYSILKPSGYRYSLSVKNSGELTFIGSGSGEIGVRISNSGKLQLLGCNVKGIDNNADAWLLIDGATVKDSNGCGVYNDGTVIMNRGEISGNYGSDGGGIYNTGTFTMNGGKITSNRTGGKGAGIYNTGTFIYNGGRIDGNYTYMYDIAEGDDYGMSYTMYHSNAVYSTGILEFNREMFLYVDNKYVPVSKYDEYISDINRFTTLEFRYSVPKSEYEEPPTEPVPDEEIDSWKELQKRLLDGGSIVLQKDLKAGSADKSLVVPEGVTAAIDLIGHKI